MIHRFWSATPLVSAGRLRVGDAVVMIVTAGPGQQDWCEITVSLVLVRVRKVLDLVRWHTGKRPACCVTCGGQLESTTATFRLEDTLVDLRSVS